MDNNDINLRLTATEAQFIFNTLGELPTKTACFPLLLKIKEQVEAQMPPASDR